MNLRIGLSALAAVAALGLAPLAANADVTATGLSAGPTIGSTGYGASVGYALPGGTVVRAQSGNFTYNPNFNSNGNTYNGHLNLSNIIVDAEFHPTVGSFYYAAGAMIDNNRINASTTSAGVTIGNTNYGAGTANATVSWTTIVPYVGLGWAPVHGGFGIDLGAAFIGNSKVAVSSNIVGVTAADYASAQAQISSSVNKYTIYPVINLRYTWGL